MNTCECGAVIKTKTAKRCKPCANRANGRVSAIALTKEYIEDRVVKTHDGHWRWQRATNAAGYGICNIRSAGSEQMAHRVAWLIWKGPIPDGMEIDHDCRVRDCVNPDHLLLITGTAHRHENGWHLKTHCPSGHPYDEVNTYQGPDGRRHCRICGREATKRSRLKKAARNGNEVVGGAGE